MKSNNRIKVREACRVTANHFRKQEEFLLNELSDSASVVKNNPDDVKAYVDQLSTWLNDEAFTRIGGSQAIINRLPCLDSTHAYLCVYDFYKALRDSKYFSVDRALKRIRQFGLRHVGNMTYTRKNARGHWTSAASPNRKAYTQSFCSEFNYNWRMILSLGARLAKGNDRSLEFKANGTHHSYIESKMVEGSDSKFTVTCSSMDAATIAQVDLFLQAMTPGIFTYIRHGHVFYIEVKQASKVQVPELTLEQKEVIKGELNVSKLSSVQFLNIYKPDLVPVEEHFFKQMETSVNEMTINIDNFDAQIDELEGKASKLRAQRAKLLKAMQELRK